MRIRRFEIADWNAVCAVYDLAKPAEFEGEDELPSVPPLNEDPKMQALFHESKVIVAELDGKVVGFAGTRGNYISWLFVHPSHRRVGVATNLLEEATRDIQGTIELNVAKSNTAASLLYRRLGFQTKREFTGNFNGKDCQVIRLHRGEA